MKGAGTLLNQFEIMIRIQLPLIVAKDPGMRGQPFAGMKEIDPVNVQLDLDLETHIPAGDGIAVFIHSDRGIGVHFAAADLGDGEGHGRQRQEAACSSWKNSFTVFSLPLEPVVAIGQTFGQELLVQGLKTVGLRQRHEVVALDVAHQALDAAFLVGRRRVTEAGRKIIVGVELGKLGLLHPASAPQDLAYRRGQVVVDQGGEDTAEKGKGMQVGVKKGLLPLTGIAAHEVFGGIPGTHAKKLDGGGLAPNDRQRRAPVHLSFPAYFRIQRNEGLGHVQPQAHLGSPYIMPHVGLTAGKTMLPHQAVINPPGRMALLLRAAFVLLQPAVDDR